MPGESSNPAGWWLALEPVPQALFFGHGDHDDPRLGDAVHRWQYGPMELRPGQPVVLGFPCDEGVRRNGGRPGAALAPEAIRRLLYRLTSWDVPCNTDLAALTAVDAGDIRAGPLEESQVRLGEVIGGVLQNQAVPIVLGGGHETAFGQFLGFAEAGLDCAVINIDAHLDVRPYPLGGHSGSPFRQAMEHARRPVRDGRYVVIGAQRQSVARIHAAFMKRHNQPIHWLNPRRPEEAIDILGAEMRRLREGGAAILLTIDADAFRQADVPGVSAPGPLGLPGWLGPEIAQLAGAEPGVRSLSVVEVNPTLDRDDQTARWAALVVRQFLVGLATRT